MNTPINKNKHTSRLLRLLPKISKKIIHLLVFTFITFNAENSFSQVKIKNKTYPIDSIYTKLTTNLHKFNDNKYNNLDSSFFWVMNAECVPIENARITISNNMGFSDTITKHSYDGLYFIKSPSYGLYKITVEAPGYERQMQHMEVYPMVKRLKKRIALGKPGDIYLPTAYGFFPLTNPVEHVSLHMVKPYKDTAELNLHLVEFWKEIDKLRQITDSTYTNTQWQNPWLVLPLDSVKRNKFSETIEKSSILKIYSLQIIRGYPISTGALVNSINFMIDGSVEEKTIRSVLERNNFVVHRIRMTVDKNWVIDTFYKAMLSKELFIDIQKVNYSLPMIWASIDNIIGAEHSR